MLVDGDLAVGSSGDYQTVSDVPKVRQEVTAALLEPLGNDRFHPGWGSTLPDLVGETITPFLRNQVLGEVNRIVGNYAAIQRDKVEVDTYSDSNTRFTTAEIVAAVRRVTVQSSFDMLRVNIVIGTLDGSLVTISEDLG